MDAVDSPRVPLWARIGLGALLLAFLLGISFLVIWVGLRTGRWGLIVLGVLFLAGTAVLTAYKLRRRKKRESHQERPPVRTFRTGGLSGLQWAGRYGMLALSDAWGHAGGQEDSMPFDFKKEYREFYLPNNAPEIVTVPAMRYVAVRGEGDPNVPGGAYQQAIGVLYAVAYTLKMSYKTDHAIPGFFQYVVPPLEGFWQQAGGGAVDYSRKDAFRWISAIRLPDFVGEADFAWAVETAAKKKKLDCSAAELLTVEEGLCVQMLHLGPYDTEPESVARMEAYLREGGYVTDFTDKRLHHEIYLSDPRKAAPEKWKTVIRHPIRKEG